MQAIDTFRPGTDEDGEPAIAADVDAALGFPSGHVATATAFLLRIALLFRWRAAWTAMLVWVPVMAVSRLYLGRHFVGDVLGGVAVGVISTAIAVRWWRLARIEDPERGWRIARRAALTGVGLALLALVVGIPPTYEAGRLIGAGLGAMLVARGLWSAAEVSWPARVRRIGLAAGLYAITWWSTSAAATLFVEGYTAVGAILAGALPAAVLLPGPLYIESRTFRRN